ncbi:MAG: transposase, partial [Candidatus Limnocylindrus sp.]
MKRLTKFLDCFAGSFVRGGQSGNALRYVRGLLSDAKRKNMEGMLQRLSDPGQYQTLQHFITHSTWESDAIWEQLRSQVPDRRGLLLIDDTSIPKQGRESAGVARQYCGALGKIANCQVVVTTALRAKQAVWPLEGDVARSSRRPPRVPRRMTLDQGPDLAADLRRRHLRLGWWALLAWAVAGLVLEGL